MIARNEDFLSFAIHQHRFDILEFGFKTTEDESGMLKTVHSLNQLITAEIDGGLDSSRIVLGGFSQGSTMSLLTGLTGERKLGGLVCLSGWLPLRDKFKSVSLVCSANSACFTHTRARVYHSSI
jgi:predicted esterase